MVGLHSPVPGRELNGPAQEWCACATPHIPLYLGPLPPSRGVQRGPTTSVALQSTQFGALTRSAPSTTSYTPAGHTWEMARSGSTPRRSEEHTSELQSLAY